MRNALKLDEINRNSLWREAIQKELDQINQFNTFQVLQQGQLIPEGNTRIPLHMVYDVKHDLRRKARLVAGGNWTENPTEDVYSTVISFEGICLGIVCAVIFGLKIMVCDIGNAYLHAKTKEKVYTVAGPKFGPLQGQVLLIKQALGS